MGCGGSRLDHGSGSGLQPRFRVEEFRTQDHAEPLKDSSSADSKTGLLLHDKDDESEGAGMPKDKEVSLNKINVEEDDDRRMIGHDHAFPGSPSFRVYFGGGDGEDEHMDLGKIKNSASESTLSSEDDAVSSKESNCDDENTKVKRGKMMSFRKVLAKGGQAAAFKNLLGAKSCYHTSPSAHHHHRHLLTEKTTA